MSKMSSMQCLLGAELWQSFHSRQQPTSTITSTSPRCRLRTIPARVDIAVCNSAIHTTCSSIAPCASSRPAAWQLGRSTVSPVGLGGSARFRSHALTVCHAAEGAGQGSGSALTEILATLTGYCVLIGSVFRSVPQILRIVGNSSVEGLSLTSFVSELIAYTIIWAYNLNLGYPFSTFGEIVACWIQDIILVGLVLYYRKQMNVKVIVWTLLFAAFMTTVMTNACGPAVLYGLQASTIVMISVGARMPQIWMNYKRGNSGELSLLTCLLNVMGCFARMFTTIVLTKDKLNLIAAVVQAVLNSILLYQTVKTARDPMQEALREAKAS